MKIKISELESQVKKVLLTKYDESDTDLITKVVMFGQLSGKTSHGIVRLHIGNSSIIAQKPSGKPKLINKSKISSIVEGNGNPGMLVAVLACKEAIRLAKENGIGIVGTRRSFSSSGCISYYLEETAKQNLISIVMAQSPLSTPPHGGIQPLFGTNPISWGIPSIPRPLIFDMATSAISFGALLKARELGQELPENVAIDNEGNITTDPNKAIEGATLPFDNSYKGAGLAMIVEILAGVWPGASFAIHNEQGGWGNTFIAIDPELLMTTDEFKRKVNQLTETIRNSKTKDGNKVRIPGENTLNTRDDNLKSGYIEVEDVLLNKLNDLAKSA